MSPVAAWICGTIGFFILLGILAVALWFGLSGIPAGDSRNRKDAETNAHGRGLDYDRCSQPGCTICAVASPRREGQPS